MTDHVLGPSKKVPVSKVLHVASSSEMARYYHLDTAFPAEQGPHKAGETISDKTSISAIMNDIEPNHPFRAGGHSRSPVALRTLAILAEGFEVTFDHREVGDQFITAKEGEFRWLT